MNKPTYSLSGRTTYYLGYYNIDTSERTTVTLFNKLPNKESLKAYLQDNPSLIYCMGMNDIRFAKYITFIQMSNNFDIPTLNNEIESLDRALTEMVEVLLASETGVMQADSSHRMAYYISMKTESIVNFE